MDLRNKKILVTGSAIRVGAEIIKAFASEGCQVFIHFNNSKEQAIELANSLNNATIIQANLALDGDLERLEELIESEDIDILVNNASIYEHFNLQDNSSVAIEKHKKINYMAPLILMEKLLLNAERFNKERVIINILDQMLLANNKVEGAYFQSKQMLLEKSLEFAKNFGKYNLRVNGIAPGPLLAPATLADTSMKKTLPTLPLKRQVAMDDFVNTVLFIAKNSSMTGAIVPLDCGQHLIF